MKANITGLIGACLLMGTVTSCQAQDSANLAGDVNAVLQSGAKVERLGAAFKFIEGPAWQQGRLVFSDIPANAIYSWTPGSISTTRGTVSASDSKFEIFRFPSGNSNGLAFDRQGRLIACQNDRRVTRTEKDGRVVTIAETYSGKKLNSPNDCSVRSDGSIYFTDPPYGINKEQEEQGFSGIYRIAPDGKLQLVSSEMARPNGLAFSPDEKRLYVNDSQDNVMRVFDVQPDGTLANGRVLVDLKAPGLKGAADGMKVNAQGDIITSAPGGVCVVSPNGTVRARILLPETTTNVAWGDSDWKTLYITASNTLYRVRMKVAGWQQGISKPR